MAMNAEADSIYCNHTSYAQRSFKPIPSLQQNHTVPTYENTLHKYILRASVSNMNQVVDF